MIHTNISYIVPVGPDFSKQILLLFRKGFSCFDVVFKISIQYDTAFKQTCRVLLNHFLREVLYFVMIRLTVTGWVVQVQAHEKFIL